MTLTIREPGSALTHFIGCIMAAIAAIPLIIKAPTGISTMAMTIFMISMILLYGASATYHSVNVSEKVIKIFKKIDHMMIFVLICRCAVFNGKQLHLTTELLMMCMKKITFQCFVA